MQARLELSLAGIRAQPGEGRGLSLELGYEAVRAEPEAWIRAESGGKTVLSKGSQAERRNFFPKQPKPTPPT